MCKKCKPNPGCRDYFDVLTQALPTPEFRAFEEEIARPGGILPTWFFHQNRGHYTPSELLSRCFDWATSELGFAYWFSLSERMKENESAKEVVGTARRQPDEEQRDDLCSCDPDIEDVSAPRSVRAGAAILSQGC